MEILVRIKAVYGNDLIYPACEKSELFARIANKRTLGEGDINLIKKLGYKVLVQSDVKEL